MKNLFFLSMIFIFLVQCTENNSIEPIQESEASQKDSGQVLFYTDAQFKVNCGEFDVNVYINDSLAGKIKRPFLPYGSIPTCEMQDSLTIIKFKKEVGIYSYAADFYCSPKHPHWVGNFEINKDSCTVIYLKIN